VACLRLVDEDEAQGFLADEYAAAHERAGKVFKTSRR
jgi:hypothetical protein